MRKAEKNYKCDFHRVIISNSCIFSLFLIGGKLSMNNILRHRFILVTFLITRKIKDNPFGWILGRRIFSMCFSSLLVWWMMRYTHFIEKLKSWEFSLQKQHQIYIIKNFQSLISETEKFFWEIICIFVEN